MNNYAVFNYKVPMLLKNFEELYENGELIKDSLFQYQINDLTYEENYLKFKKRVFNSLGKQFLPIYRMADGEFYFIRCLVGENLSNVQKIKRILGNIKTLLGKDQLYGRKLITIKFERFKNLLNPYFFTVAHNEFYNNSTLNKIRTQYIAQLHNIAQYGMLALHFVESQEQNHPYSKDYNFIIEWLQNNHIFLNEINYTSFYYIYALLTDKSNYTLLTDKNILIITSFNYEKMKNIELFLNEKLKPRVIQFYNISATNSMTEQIDIHKLKTYYDLVLIGAGVGSVNILSQLSFLNTVCIDCGIILELFANPKLAKTRIFLTTTY